ncbi:DUF2062 domain-containing protein [Effusibacillus consociatus]|uniref:DUF2062 domain-containing protein n=1 Tax=Effusibacillus consociatus TaxID=1117041 RepID=A0ABV9Q870_9BACL
MSKSKALTMKRLGRSMKYQYVKLLRSPGGAKKVAMGFAIGFGLEFMVISTAMLVYIIFYPLVRVARGSMPAAIIGHVIGKLTFLPIPMLGLGKCLGDLILPFHIHMPAWLPGWLEGFLNVQLKTLIGMTLISTALGILTYPIVYYLYEANRKRRAEKLARKLLQVQDNGQ